LQERPEGRRWGGAICPDGSAGHRAILTETERQKRAGKSELQTFTLAKLLLVMRLTVLRLKSGQLVKMALDLTPDTGWPDFPNGLILPEPGVFRTGINNVD